MKPHIKRREVYSPYESFPTRMRWCVYEPKYSEDWFGFGDTIKEAWKDYLLEKMWYEVIVSDETGGYDEVCSIEDMIQVCGYPEGYLE